MKLEQPIPAALMLISLLVIFSVVSLKLTLYIPEAGNVLMFESCIVSNLYKPIINITPQNKILVDACHKIVTREPIMMYLEKQEKSPPAGTAFRPDSSLT